MRAPAIIRSGWWVAVAAVGLSLVVAAILIIPIFADRPGDRNSPDFDLTNTAVPPELIVRGMARDGVRTLLEPATIEAAEVDRYNKEERGKLLVSDDRVIGIAIGGEARAYPLRLMRWHEVVNDVVGGRPIAVTYSPLCDSVVVFSRQIDGARIELGVSGLLFNSNTLLYDRLADPAEATLWAQLTGRPVAGPDPGSAPALALELADLTTWDAWRRDHPNTTILAQLPELKKLYKRDPYHSYFGSDLLRFPVDPLPPPSDLRLKDRVVVVRVDGVDVAFALPHLARAAGSEAGVVEVEVSGLPIRIRFRCDPGVATVEPLAEPARLQAIRYAFWFAWHAMTEGPPRPAAAARNSIETGPKKGTTPGTIRSAG
jgi:hypothetical protein